MNTALRRALADADLTEVDVAVGCEVDPKTVRAWLSGRLPYPRNRRKIARLVARDETDLWPGADAGLESADVCLAYAHRWAVPREEWISLFTSAAQEIGILVYAGLFLAEDEGIRHVLADKARAGVRVRILLGDPAGRSILQRGVDEGIGDAMAAKARNALAHYRTLGAMENVDIRLHETVLYASVYRADDQLLANVHAYGLAAAQTPVFRIRAAQGGEVARLYLDSFERVWHTAKPHHEIRAGRAG
jgi:hypothetical protein